MNQFQGKLYLILGFLLAGTSVVTARILLEKLGSFTIAAAGLGLLLLFLTPFYWKKLMQAVRTLSIADWKMLILQAVFGIFLFRVFLLLGVQNTSTIEAGILTGATPAITVLLAYLLIRERLMKKSLLGVCCTVAGIVLLQGINLAAKSFSMDHFWGNVWILCAAASESMFQVFSRKHQLTQAQKTQIEPMEQMLLVSFLAFLLCIIPALLERPVSALLTIGPTEWFALLWYGLVVTAVSYALFYAGIKRSDAYTAAACSGMMPLTSVLLSMLLFGESLLIAHFVGGALILLSMLLIGEKKLPSGKQPAAAPLHEKSLQDILLHMAIKRNTCSAREDKFR